MRDPLRAASRSCPGGSAFQAESTGARTTADRPAGAAATRGGELLTMPDVLFIKTSSLGDVIHHMPALMEARRQRPAARFYWVVEEAFAPLVQIHPAISEVIPVASRRWRGTPLAPATWREI